MKKLKAVIDIGTNSIKFCLGDMDESEVVRLGEGLHETGLINERAIERGASVVKKFVEMARQAHADEIIAVGTMALRTAKNASEFLARVKELCGIEIRVISGDEEARLAFLAASSFAHGHDCVVFDTGGGSTELIYGRGEEIFDRRSINVGAVNLTETHSFPPLLKGGRGDWGEFLIGIGGTVTTMASVKHALAEYDPKIIDGTKMTLDDVEAQIKLYANLTLEERKKIVGLNPKRADIILAGARIVKTIMDYLEMSEFIVSARGIRHVIASFCRYHGGDN